MRRLSYLQKIVHNLKFKIFKNNYKTDIRKYFKEQKLFYKI